MTARGLLVTIDGPGGAGKSTLARRTAEQLSAAGIPATATAQPSTGPMGVLARQHTHELRGLALACLVAADRYHHLDTHIRPALAAGQVVICDRYVASSYVLQALDGVDQAFIQHINAHADPPDLAVFLHCDPGELQRRLTVRGSHGRFEDTPGISHAETARFHEAALLLKQAGIPTLHLDSTSHNPDFLSSQLTSTIRALWSRRQH